MKNTSAQSKSETTMASRTYSLLTGPLASAVAKGLFCVWAALLIVAMPMCFAESQLAERAKQEGLVAAVCRLADTPSLRLLKIDKSACTVIAIAIFFGILVRAIEYCRRFDGLEQRLSGIGKVTQAASASRHPDLAPLFDAIGRGSAGRSADDRLNDFHRHLLEETRIRHYCGYEVALGLVGTLLAFYLGFAERLSGGMKMESLDETARQLLTCVGTAAISSVVGILLGMLVIPPLADYLAWRRRVLVDQASAVLAAVAGSEV